MPLGTGDPHLSEPILNRTTGSVPGPSRSTASRAATDQHQLQAPLRFPFHSAAVLVLGNTERGSRVCLEKRHPIPEAFKNTHVTGSSMLTNALGFGPRACPMRSVDGDLLQYFVG